MPGSHRKKGPRVEEPIRRTAVWARGTWEMMTMVRALVMMTFLPQRARPLRDPSGFLRTPIRQPESSAEAPPPPVSPRPLRHPLRPAQMFPSCAFSGG
jgi:hypothetical protein